MAAYLALPVPRVDFTRVIFYRDRKFLVLQSAKRQRWEFPGGKLEPGESPQAAAIREAQEEVGVKVFGLNHVLRVDVTTTDDSGVFAHYVGHMYHATNWQGEPIKREDKHLDLKWVTFDELVCLPQRPVFTLEPARHFYGLSTQVSSRRLNQRKVEPKVGRRATVRCCWPCEMNGKDGEIIHISSDPKDTMPIMLRFDNYREWPFAADELEIYKGYDEEEAE